MVFLSLLQACLIPGLDHGKGDPRRDSDAGIDSSPPLDDSGGSDPPADSAPGDTAEEECLSDGSPNLVFLDSGEFARIGPGGGYDTIEFSVSYTGDYWGDGLPEIMISDSYYYDADWYAEVYIIDSSTEMDPSLIANPSAIARVKLFSSDYAITPSNLGDIDGDRLDDVFTQNPIFYDLDHSITYSPGVPLFRGSTIAGATGVLVPSEDADVYIDSVFEPSIWVEAVAGGGVGSGFLLGDDADGSDVVLWMDDDIVVIPSSALEDGIYTVDGEGEAVIYVDSDGPESSEDDTYACCASVIPDVNGDGLDELGLGTWTHGGTPRNLSAVFFGGGFSTSAPTSIFDADLLVESSPLLGNELEQRVQFHPLGDTNGDGLSDLVLSQSELEVDGLVARGAAWFWSGARFAVSGSIYANDGDVEFVTDRPHSRLGETVVDVGDRNSDGFSDFLIHSGGYDDAVGPTERPFVYLVEGSEMSGGGCFNIQSAGLAFQSEIPIEYSSQGQYAGDQDIDGDGVNDLLIGTNFDWLGPRRVWLIPGSTLTF